MGSIEAQILAESPAFHEALRLFDHLMQRAPEQAGALAKHSSASVNDRTCEDVFQRIQVLAQPEVQAVSRAVRRLARILSSTGSEGRSTDVLVACTVLSADAANVILASLPESTPPAERRSLSVGNFLSLKWKLGVIAASSRCKRHGSPFVTLTWTVADSNDEQRVMSVELSFAEFQSLKKSLVDVATSLGKL